MRQDPVTGTLHAVPLPYMDTAKLCRIKPVHEQELFYFSKIKTSVRSTTNQIKTDNSERKRDVLPKTENLPRAAISRLNAIRRRDRRNTPTE
jgi:hypothetical protein